MCEVVLLTLMDQEQTRFDNWLGKAFELALFLHGDRKIAVQIVVGAMDKLETASNAQFKRRYYTPTGRAETARNAARSRVSLNDLQLLQRLVYVESERHEREKESSGKADETCLLKHFLKHLVRISLKRNSFYATLAVTRILHSYQTNEAMEIYNLVVQDPERVHDDYYFRSRKAQLMRELKTRFGETLLIVRGNRGEERFESCETAENYSEIVKDCFAHLTPWATKCVLTDETSILDEIIKPLAFSGTDPDAEHRIELNRLHTILHQSCLEKLIESLGFSPAAEKLEIPKFVMKNQNSNKEPFDDWHDPESLTETELEQIKRALTAAAATRKAATCGLMRVFVDGEMQALIDFEEFDGVNFELSESAELIEVRAGDTVMATRLLNFEDLEHYEQFAQSVTLADGQKIWFQITPSRNHNGEIAGANCVVRLEETRLSRKAAYFWQNLVNSQASPTWLLKPAVASVLLLLLAALIYQLRPVTKEQAVFPNNNSPQILPNFVETPEPQNISAPTPNKVSNSNKKPKNDKQTSQPETNSKSAPANRQPKRQSPSSVTTPSPHEEMAVDPTLPKSIESPVYRSPIYQTPVREKKNEVRGNPHSATFKAGKTLREIETLYVEVIGSQQFDREIWQLLQEKFGETGRFVITRDKDQADAALKISVRRESDRSETTNALTSAVVRVVNANGFVIYPHRKNITGWKYAGRASELPERIIKDLSLAAKTLKE